MKLRKLTFTIFVIHVNRACSLFTFEIYRITMFPRNTECTKRSLTDSQISKIKYTILSAEKAEFYKENMYHMYVWRWNVHCLWNWSFQFISDANIHIYWFVRILISVLLKKKKIECGVTFPLRCKPPSGLFTITSETKRMQRDLKNVSFHFWCARTSQTDS